MLSRAKMDKKVQLPLIPPAPLNPLGLCPKAPIIGSHSMCAMVHLTLANPGSAIGDIMMHECIAYVKSWLQLTLALPWCIIAVSCITVALTGP